MDYPVERRLPKGLVARLRQYADSGASPVTPRHAATVVLLRDRSDGAGVEAYLLRRARSMAFAPGAYVFPGGSVDPRDADRTVGWAGPPPAEWASLLDTDASLARALVCAAVRETFEESGVLLAGPTSDTVVEDTRGEAWEAARRALLDRSLPFGELLERRGLVLRADLLRPWAHWVTPEFEPRRYDTHFFVAALPGGQRARDVGGEADRVAWMRPPDALDAYRRGELVLLPPTVATLAELAEVAGVAEALAAGSGCDLSPRMPKPVLSDEGAYLLLPGDPGYES